MPHTQETARNRVNSFRLFNSETSEAVSNLTAVNSAQELVDYLHDNNLLFPGIFAGEDEGNIRFEWSDDSLDLLITVEMDNEGNFWFFAMHPDEGYHESVDISSSQEAKALLKRLLHGNPDLLFRYTQLDKLISRKESEIVPEQTIQQARLLLNELVTQSEVVGIPSSFITDEGNILFGWANSAYVVEVELDGNNYECYQLGTEGEVDSSSMFSTQNINEAVDFFAKKEALFIEWDANNA